MSDTSNILAAAGRGEPQAAERLWSLVYDELRKIAAAKLAQEKPGQTLQATALVHEAYLRLVGDRGERTGGSGSVLVDQSMSPVSCPLSPPSFSSRSHFFAAAA